MRRFLIFLFLLGVSLDIYSQEKIPVWRGLRYNRAAIWIYKPVDNNNHTAVIICPGGSYNHLGIFHEGHNVAKELVKYGFTAVVLRYRTAMYAYHYPAMMNDLGEAMKIVKERYSELDVSRTGLIGFSAGGHLVGWMAENYSEDYPPAFVAMGYPVVSMDNDIVHAYSRKNLLVGKYKKTMMQKMSLEKNVNDAMPPMFIFYSKDDNVVNCQNSIRMIDSLRSHNKSVEELVFEKGGHGFGFLEDKENSHLWIEAFLKWVQSIDAD